MTPRASRKAGRITEPAAPTPVARVRWNPSVRIVSARTRPAAVLEGVVAPDELDDVVAIRDAGQRPALRPADVVTGPGAGWIMAPFLHPTPQGSRFSNGTYGVYYAAHAEGTAVAETTYHYARFLTYTREAPRSISVCVLHAALDGRLVDIRGGRVTRPDLYDPDPAHYGAPQAWANEQHRQGAAGIVYDSVRHAGGECVAIFRPPVLRRCVPKHYLLYEWDGTAVVGVHVLRPRPV